MRTLPVVLLLALAAVAPVGCGPGEEGAGGAALGATRILAVRVDETIPAADPAAAIWSEVPAVLVPLLIQDVAEPRLTEAGTEVVTIQAAHDGGRIAFRATWEDPSAEGLLDVDRFADALALQFPATGVKGALPDAMMGEEGQPVAIVHWSYARQVRSEGLPHGIAALFPNATTDHYPPDAGRDEATRTAMRTRYAPGRAAGNPVTEERPTHAVTDLLAEGFGTLRPAGASVSTGSGTHENGAWTVVVSRPLDRAGGSATAFVPGGSTMLAVAVWNGRAAHVGARKMRSSWIRLEIEGSAP